jgi:uncharacterized protein YdeI (YjbR/CyaY-like superfamily)
MKATFFPTPSAWRTWLATHHAKREELWVGFYKRDSGRPSITWPQSVDEALCYGWIDGIRRSLDVIRYVIRFTPRRPGSTWSAINIRRVAELKRQRRMRAAGLRAFERRIIDTSYAYSYEQRKTAKLTAADERAFKANTKAWRYFLAQPPWYRRTSCWYVISAKREETRRRRLAELVACSARGRLIPPLARAKALASRA